MIYFRLQRFGNPIRIDAAEDVVVLVVVIDDSCRDGIGVRAGI